ncbi:hypothetical protein EO238_28285, partial [Citrobacter sp. AAK_AS5]
DPEDLLDALQQQKDHPGDAESQTVLGDILVSLGSINDVALAAALASQFGVPLADLTQARPEPQAVARVPEEMARRLRVLPLRVDEN